RSPPSANCLQKRFQLLGPRRVAELPERLRLDLSDPLAGDVEGAADLFQGVLRAVADAKPHLQDLLFPRRQGLQDPAGLILEIRGEGRLQGRKKLRRLAEIY